MSFFRILYIVLYGTYLVFSLLMSIFQKFLERVICKLSTNCASCTFKGPLINPLKGYSLDGFKVAARGWFVFKQNKFRRQTHLLFKNSSANSIFQKFKVAHLVLYLEAQYKIVKRVIAQNIYRVYFIQRDKQDFKPTGK